MPPQEQADLWMALRDRMKTNWHELTLAEKKAGMFGLILSASLTPADEWESHISQKTIFPRV
jgi:Cytochrome c oxidase subunit IV